MRFSDAQRREYLSMIDRVGLAWLDVFEGNTEFYSANYWDLLTELWRQSGPVRKTDALRCMKAVRSAHTAGKYLEEWNHPLLRPTAIAFDNDGHVFIPELAMRVSVFSLDGQLLGRWGNGTEDMTSALFHGPHAVAVDSHGAVYVGDVALTHCGMNRGSNTIRKFKRVG